MGTVEIKALVGTSERASLHRPILLRLLLAYALYIYIYYPVDISTTVFSYSHAVQYHTILHSAGVIARVLLHGSWGYAVS